MKSFKLSGLQILILKEALFRPTEAATVQTFISIQRLVVPLKLQDVSIDKEVIYDIQLEDSDFAFLVSEWKKANDPSRPMWVRQGQGIDHIHFMSAIIALDSILCAAH